MEQQKAQIVLLQQQGREIAPDEPTYTSKSPTSAKDLDEKTETNSLTTETDRPSTIEAADLDSTTEADAIAATANQPQPEPEPAAVPSEATNRAANLETTAESPIEIPPPAQNDLTSTDNNPAAPSVVAVRAFANKTVAIAGSLLSLNREEAKARIQAAGGRVTNSLNPKTHYLIVGKSAGSKLKKAEKWGIAQLSETQLLAMLETGDAAGQ